MEPLDEGESLRLLGSVRWGRLAWNTLGGPRILPVNHSVVDANVYFRTGLYGSLLGSAAEDAVAFEADDLDDRLSFGWSVVVLGHADQVDDPAEVASLFQRMDEPWAPGTRPVLVRVTPSQVTGRRFSRD
jgi:nitroimidazol reductase NimA-like FMN-containing flavoprotein (pyridoxamine 5'-phosphate oxidase superfamily)